MAQTVKAQSFGAQGEKVQAGRVARAGRAGVMAWMVAGVVLCAGSMSMAQSGGKPADWGTPPPAKEQQPGPGKPASGDDAKEATVDLRPKFEVGRVTRYVQTVDSQSLGGLAGGLPGGLDGLSELTGGSPSNKPAKTRLVETSEISMKTVAVDTETGQATVEMTTTRVKVEITSDDFSFAYDSEKKKNASGKQPASKTPGRSGAPATGGADDITSEMLEGVLEGFYGQKVGQKLRMTVNRDGSIAKVEGGGGNSPDALAGLSGIGGAGGAAAGDLFGPVRSGGVDVSKVRVGQRWTHDSKAMVGPVGELAMRTEHVLRSASRGEANVDFSGTVKTDSSESNGGGRLASIGPSTYQGSMVWDRARGELKKLSSTMEIGATTAASGKGPGQNPGKGPGKAGGGSGNGGKESQSNVRMTFERIER